MELQIIFEDDRMVVCNKPTGVLAQSGKSFDVDMVSALMNYRKKKGEDTFVGVINRLDRQVSGLMVFAKTKEEAARLNKLMQGNSFDKYYFAVVCGQPNEDKGSFVDYLIKDGKSNTSAVGSKDSKDAKRAELEYEVMKSIVDVSNGEKLTLVKIHLITGRHHQIRVQFANRGLALKGDTKYGVTKYGVTKYKDTNSVNMKSGDTNSVSTNSREPQYSNSDNASINNSNGIALCAYSLQIGKDKFEIEPEGSIFKLFE